MENRKNTGLMKTKLPNDATVQEQDSAIKVIYQALKEMESELQNLRDDNNQLRDELLGKDRQLAETRALLVDREEQLAARTLLVDTLKEMESELQNLRDDNNQLRDELLGKDRQLAETRTLLVDREQQLSNTQTLLVDREQQLAAGTLLVDKSGAAYRPPLRAIQIQPTRAIQTPARVGAVTTSLVNQLDACNEKEMEDEGIKGPKTGIELKRSARQLVLSFLKTASVEELQTFKGIGEKRGRTILELRELSPEVFASVKDVLDSIEVKKSQMSNMMWDMMVEPLSEW